jgi:hypothetical protein
VTDPSKSRNLQEPEAEETFAGQFGIEIVVAVAPVLALVVIAAAFVILLQ